MATTQEDARAMLAEVDFPSAEAMQDPYPLYRALRSGPPVQLPTGEFVVSRHRDVFKITRQPEVFSSHHSIFEDGWMKPATLEHHYDPDFIWGIVSSDPPEHTWKRKLSFEMFKPGRLREREPMIRGYVNELLDPIIPKGKCEFVGEFADKLPAEVILTLFGLPLEYLDRAMGWGRYEGFGTRWASMEAQQGARDGIVDLGQFIAERVLERADDPGDDDLSRHVQRHKELRGKLDLPNIVAEASNLFIGGIITTTHLISSMMRLFIEYPGQQEKARSSQQMLKRAVEETLRLEGPVQMGVRLAVEDTEIDGVKIPKGSHVLVVWGAANHDEEKFEDPETFNIDRPNAKDHMGFGNGPHFCLGAPLGRLEAVIAFEEIFKRMENMRFSPDHGPVQNHWAVIFRGPKEMHIEFDPVG